MMELEQQQQQQQKDTNMTLPIGTSTSPGGGGGGGVVFGNGDVAVVVVSEKEKKRLGGIGWAGSLVGSLNPEQNLGYRTSNPMKRYRSNIHNEDGSNTDDTSVTELPSNVQILLKNRMGIELTTTLDIPIHATIEDLTKLVYALVSEQQDESTTTTNPNQPYSFYLNKKQQQNTMDDNDTDDIEITHSIYDLLVQYRNKGKNDEISTEQVLQITYQPLALYKVRPITRCTGTLRGHTDAILHVSFSPAGNYLVSGGGDALVRFWDINTGTPKYCSNTTEHHKNHVLCTGWSTDNRYFASGDKNGYVIIWDPKTGQPISNSKKSIQAHKQYITSIVWEPYHLCSGHSCNRFATSSKDCTIKIWNMQSKIPICEKTLSGHTDSVECIKWSGEVGQDNSCQILYSASRDRTIKVWNITQGILMRTLTGHGHRVNTIALSTDYIVRTGPFCTMFRSELQQQKYNDYQAMVNEYTTYPERAKEAAIASYKHYKQQTMGGVNNGDNNNNSCCERLVSGSDDFTIIIWNPLQSKHPMKRLTGHQQLINHLVYSPDGRYFVSASFDKKIKLWNGYSGEYITTFTGHVGPVYQVAFSPDSQFLVSASKDSTCKLWQLNTSSSMKIGSSNTAKDTLPGHEDEVYTIDWNPNGSTVATGSKDRTIKIWKH